MTRARLIAIVSLILLAAWAGIAEHRVTQAKRLGLSTAYSAGPQGFSILYRLMNLAQDESAALQRVAVFTEDQLADRHALLILGPALPLSARETSILVGYVHKGGNIVLSFTEEKEVRMVEKLLSTADFALKIKTYPNFENGSVTRIKPADSRWIFEADRPYDFYSNVVFDQSACSVGAPTLDCFLKQKQLGKGRIIALLGFPPFSNALIRRADNAAATLALVREYPRIALDEYRHFFTDKTLADLLMQPAFTLPIAGMIVGVILFFLFGHTDFGFSTAAATRARTKRSESGSMHETNSLILQGFITRYGGASQGIGSQVQFMQKLFPDAAKRIGQMAGNNDGRDGELASASRLIQLHRDLLREQGKI